MVYMYVCLALAAVNGIGIALYFPSTPTLPPSRSAGVYAITNKTYSWVDAKALVVTCARNRVFVILSLAYGVISGLYSGWSALESPNLGSFGISQNDAGYISGSSIAAAALGTIILGAVADKKKDHKRTLSFLLLVGLIGIVAWSLMLQGLVPLSTDNASRIGQLSSLSVVVAVGFYSTTPIFFEAAVEASHPLPQGSVIMLMTFIFNSFSIVMLAIPAQSSLFNWLLSGSALLILVLLLWFYQNQDRRSHLDA